jgi:hypothetical protein
MDKGIRHKSCAPARAQHPPARDRVLSEVAEVVVEASDCEERLAPEQDVAALEAPGLAGDLHRGMPWLVGRGVLRQGGPGHDADSGSSKAGTAADSQPGAGRQSESV